MRNFKSIMLSLLVFLMLGITFWLRSWTSFSKIGAPIAQPQTAFFSWGCVANSSGACSSTGKYWASGTLLMQIWSWGIINAYIPLLDWAGNVFLTGTTATTGRTYSGDSTILASTKAVSLYLDNYSQSLGDVYTTGGFYVSGTTISRMTLVRENGPSRLHRR